MTHHKDEVEGEERILHAIAARRQSHNVKFDSLLMMHNEFFRPTSLDF